MTPHRTFFDPATGRIEASLQAGSDEQMAALTQVYGGMGLEYVEAGSDPDLHVMVGQNVVGREATGLPEGHTVPAGVEWAVPNVPAGTVVIVDGTEAGVVPADGLQLRFDMAGAYLVELKPPFPWRPGRCAVVVV